MPGWLIALSVIVLLGTPTLCYAILRRKGRR